MSFDDVNDQTFIAYFLADREWDLEYSIKRREELHLKGSDNLNIKLINEKIRFLKKTIAAFSEHGLYLNAISHHAWLYIKIKLDEALNIYERNLMRKILNKPIKDPSEKIKRSIKHAKVVINDLALPDDRSCYSDNGKTFTNNDGRVEEVAPSSVNRVLLSKLLDKYIEDLESGTFNIAHRGSYYINYHVSKQEIKKTLSKIGKQFYINGTSADEKILLDSL